MRGSGQTEFTASSGFVALMCGTAAGVLAHIADNNLQLTLRRRLARHIGRLPLGRLTERGPVRSSRPCGTT